MLNKIKINTAATAKNN